MMTYDDLCCCSMSFLYVGSIPHSNRICSEFGSNAISSTQRCLTTPGAVKMLGAALAPWQNALLVSCWTTTSIGGVYGVLWRPETKGIVRVTLCVGIIALAFRFAQVLQFLGYLVAMAGDYNDYGIENNQTKGQSCNDGASRTMTTSRIKLICPKLQPHCHPCPIYFIQFQQHQITKWSIVLQNITQSCLEILRFSDNKVVFMTTATELHWLSPPRKWAQGSATRTTRGGAFPTERMPSKMKDR